MACLAAQSDPASSKDRGGRADHRQNNDYVQLRQWGPRQREATGVLLCFNCCDAEQSHKDNVHSAAVGQLFRV